MWKFKKCSRCNQEKSFDEFSLKNSQTQARQSICKECNRAYNKQHYKANKKTYLEKAKEYKNSSYDKFLTYMKDKSCIDCGNSDCRVLEFDHLKDKKYQISYIVKCAAWETVLKEMDKCEIVCCNCHRIRTLERSNSRKFLLPSSTG